MYKEDASSGRSWTSHLPLWSRGLPEPLFPLRPLLAEPLQQLQLLTAPVPLSNLKLIDTVERHKKKEEENEMRRRKRQRHRRIKDVDEEVCVN